MPALPLASRETVYVFILATFFWSLFCADRLLSSINEIVSLAVRDSKRRCRMNRSGRCRKPLSKQGIIGLVIGIIVFCLLISLVVIYQRRKKNKQTYIQRSMETEKSQAPYIQPPPPVYTAKPTFKNPFPDSPRSGESASIKKPRKTARDLIPWMHHSVSTKSNDTII